MRDEDGGATLYWLADALEQAYAQGHMTVVMYLESVLEEVLLELKLSETM